MNNENKTPKRIFCVDFLRGLDIFYLVVIHYAFLAPGVFKVWPSTNAARTPWPPCF